MSKLQKLMAIMSESAGRDIDVNLHMVGPDHVLRSCWIGASGVLYLSNEPSVQDAIEAVQDVVNHPGFPDSCRVNRSSTND